MQPEDRGPFAQVLQAALAFYGQEATEFALDVWWQACQGFSIEQVRKALTRHAMDPDRGHFPPKPADIVRVLQGTHQDRSLVAWGLVFDAMQRVGSYSSVDFGDAAVHCAVEDLGGWTSLCKTTMEQLGFVQKRFCDAHRAYSNRGEAVRPVPYLVGYHEITNRSLGRKVDKPVLCGPAAAVPQIERAAGVEPRRAA